MHGTSIKKRKGKKENGTRRLSEKRVCGPILMCDRDGFSINAAFSHSDICVDRFIVYGLE